MTPACVVYRHIGKAEVRRARRWATRGARVLYREAAPSVDTAGLEPLPPISDVWDEALVRTAERFLREEIAGGPALSWAEELFGTKDISAAFLRAVVGHLNHFFGELDAVHRLVGSAPGAIRFEGSPHPDPRRSWGPFIPAFLEACRSRDHREDLAAISPALAPLVPRVEAAGASRWKPWLADLARAALCLAGPPAAGEPVPVQLAIRTYDNDWDFGGDVPGLSRLRRSDFIIDGESLAPRNTVFWAERLPPARIRSLKERGYRVVRAGLRPGLPWRQALRAAFFLHQGHDWTDVYARTVAAEMFRCHAATSAFLARFRPRYFLTYNDMSSSATARTILLRRAGCRSVFYQHSSHGLVEGTESCTSALRFDVAAVWGPAMADYFNRQRASRFEQTWDVGCFWSEHARYVREEPTLRQGYVSFVDGRLRKPLSSFRKVVGIFDTTVNVTTFPPASFARFLAGVLRLAGETPEAAFLYKPKYDPETAAAAFGPDVQWLWTELGSRPNVAVLPIRFETAAVVGLSDLTVSASFTSTAVESMGCGVKALFYDAADQNPPGSVWGGFWHKIPGLVCRSEENLLARSRELLFETSAEQYQAHLRAHCARVEGRFDGRAITRLRERLMAEEAR